MIWAFSLRGYWRALIERIAWRPAITMTRLTTMAMTGRRMNRSVSFMEFPCSVVARPRGELRLGRERVVHRDGRAVSQLEGAAAHDRLAGPEPLRDRDEIAAPLAGADELLVSDGG